MLGGLLSRPSPVRHKDRSFSNCRRTTQDDGTAQAVRGFKCRGSRLGRRRRGRGRPGSEIERSRPRCVLARITPSPTFQTDVLAIESVSPDDLWNLLPGEERTKFLKAMENPSSDLTKQLLADSGSLHNQFTPWWRNREDMAVKCPAIMSIPRAMVERMPSDGPPLLYNICAVWWVPFICVHFRTIRD